MADLNEDNEDIKILAEAIKQNSNRISVDKIVAPPNVEFATAIGFYEEPYFGSLPWKLDNNVPFINGRKIRLECLPCTYYCNGCATDYSFIPSDRHRCFSGKYCPKDKNYILKTMIDGST